MAVSMGNRRSSDSLLDSTSQGGRPEDAREGGHIRGRGNARFEFTKHSVFDLTIHGAEGIGRIVSCEPVPLGGYP